MAHKIKGTYLFLIFMLGLLLSSNIWAQQNTLAWTNQNTVEIFFKTLGTVNAGIQEITLDITASGGGTPTFYLSYPNSTNDILSLPDDFDVYESPAASKHVQLLNPAAGEYRLIISQNNGGTFGSSDLDWKLTLKDLGNTNALTANIASIVTTGNPNTPVKLYYSSIDGTQIPFYLTIPGGQAVHKVVMAIESAGDEENLTINVDCPEGFLPATTTRFNSDFSQGTTDFIIPIGADCTNDEGPRKISFIKISSTEYTVEITFCQDIPSGSCAPNDSPIGDEDWVITVKGLDSVPADRDSVKVSFTAYRNNTAACIEEELPSVHIEMKHPPIAIINSPTNGLFTELHNAYYYDVVAGPPDGNYVDLIGDYYADFPLADTLPIKWEFDDGDADTDYTDINPPSTHFIPGAYEIILTVKDNKNRESTDRAVIFIDDPPSADIAQPAGSSPVIVTGGGIALEGDDGIAAFEPTHSYEWDFSNGGSSNVEAPGAEIFLPGKYDLNFTVSETLNKNGVDYIRTASTIKQMFARPVEKALFPAQIGVPRGGLYRVPPAIDGNVDIEIDKGWTGAYRLTYNAETNTDVIFQALRHDSQPKVFLSFEVTDSTSNQDVDFIIIGFRATGVPGDPLTNSRILVIYPHQPPGNQVEAYRHNSTEWIPGTVPSALEIDFSDPAGGAGDWNVEMSVPTSAGSDWIDINDEFLFYFDVFVQTDTLPNPISYIFPKQIVNTDATPITQIEQLFTDPRLWALCYKTDAGSCSGVQVERWETGVKEYDGTASPPYGTSLHFDVDNEFRAKVSNDTQLINDSTGNIEYFDADEVYARFKIANWGLANEWIDISDAATVAGPSCTDGAHNDPFSLHNNPTCEKTINANDFEYYFYRWNPGTETDWTSAGGDLHQCVWVEIDSLADTYIKQTSSWINMNFPNPIPPRGAGAPGPEPPPPDQPDGGKGFSASAKIGTWGIKALPGCYEKHKIFLLIETKEWKTKRPFDPKLPDTDQMYMKASLTATGRIEYVDENAGMEGSREKLTTVLDRETSFLRWIVKGYVDTGRKIVNNGREIPILEPIGSFGHVLQFLGNTEDWEFTIEGAEKLSDSVYQIEIAPGKSTKIDYNITPIPAPKFNVSLHAGAATPVPPSNFANNYKTGFCGIIDMGYRITDKISVIGLLGYNYFPAKSTGTDPVSILNVALNAKYFIPIQPRLYLGIGAGPELFIRDFSTLDFGYDLDLSLDYKLNKLITLEAGVIYHSHFNQEVWIIQSHGGIIFNF